MKVPVQSAELTRRHAAFTELCELRIARIRKIDRLHIAEANQILKTAVLLASLVVLIETAIVLWSCT